MNVLITPFEVMDYSFISEFLFDNKYILEEVNDTFFNVEVVELSNHGLLIFQVFLV
jgi:hypothetical protein